MLNYYTMISYVSLGQPLSWGRGQKIVSSVAPLIHSVMLGGHCKNQIVVWSWRASSTEKVKTSISFGQILLTTALNKMFQLKKKLRNTFLSAVFLYSDPFVRSPSLENHLACKRLEEYYQNPYLVLGYIYLRQEIIIGLSANTQWFRLKKKNGQRFFSYHHLIQNNVSQPFMKNTKYVLCAVFISTDSNERLYSRKC